MIVLLLAFSHSCFALVSSPSLGFLYLLATLFALLHFLVVFIILSHLKLILGFAPTSPKALWCTWWAPPSGSRPRWFSGSRTECRRISGALVFASWRWPTARRHTADPPLRCAHSLNCIHPNVNLLSPVRLEMNSLTCDAPI